MCEIVMGGTSEALSIWLWT